MNKATIIIVGLIIIGLSFYGGTKYSAAQMANARQARMGQLANGFSGAREMFVTGGRGGGFIMGEILNKDDKSITLKIQDGGSVIVFLNASTTVMKTSLGSRGDLNVGGTVSVTGARGSDGTVQASSIQLRPSR